jgi:sacsin
LETHCVRISVHAASLNFADALVVQGLYQEKPCLPFVGGGELSGTVQEIGSAVTNVAVGDRVLAVLPRFGAFAESVTCRASDCFPLPSGLSLEAAAALPVAYGTAHLSLVHRCGLRAGQTVLVLGAAGGVGIAAVQIAMALGAKVVAVARGVRKLAALRAEGADVVIDSDALSGPGALKRELAAAGVKKGVDIVFDPVGGDALAEAMKCCAWGAQLAIIGFASGKIPKLPANALLVKNLTAHGIYWGSYAQHRPAVLRDSLSELLAMAAEGKLSVRVSHALPMERAHEAFAALLGRETIGKAVLVMGGRARL